MDGLGYFLVVVVRVAAGIRVCMGERGREGTKCLREGKGGCECTSSESVPVDVCTASCVLPRCPLVGGTRRAPTPRPVAQATCGVHRC